MAPPQNQYLDDPVSSLQPLEMNNRASAEQGGEAGSALPQGKSASALIELRHQEPIARGQRRYVYIHPTQPHLLIKTLRTDTPTKWYKSKRRRYGGYLSYLREVREQIALRASGGPHPPYVQKIIGFEDTDVGFGMVVQALMNSDGQLAPSLGKLVSAGRFDAEIAEALERFLDEIMLSPIILGDFHGNNIVYVDQPDGSKRFVLIDGYGFKTLIPLERIHPKINRIGKSRLFKKFRAHLETHLARAAETTSGNAT